MTEERGYYECGNLKCFDDGSWPTKTNQKGRDRVCPECGWIKVGYRSPPELGWKRVKLFRKVLHDLYPRTRSHGLGRLFTTLHGYLSASGTHLKVARVPNLAGRVVYTVLGVPVACLLHGVPNVIRDYWPEIIQPIRYGQHSTEDIFMRELDEEDFRSLFEAPEPSSLKISVFGITIIHWKNKEAQSGR